MRHVALAIGFTVSISLAVASLARAVTVADLVADPEHYDGQTVTVSGTVEVSYPVGAEGGYNLRDGASRVTVVSRAGAPAVGQGLDVTAVVHFIDGGDEPESTRFPPLLVETLRTPTP